MTSTARSADAQRDFVALLTTRVRDVVLRKPVIVDGALDLVAVCRALAAQGQTAALVRDGERIGIFTTTDLRDAVVRSQPATDGAASGTAPVALHTLAVRDVARFQLIGVQADDELLEAMLLMLRHRVHRVLVHDGDAVLGVLSQLDLVNLVANHSHVVALQIEQAAGLDELKEAAARIDDLVALLHGSGILVARVAKLVNELNAQLFERAWSLVAPPQLVANSCLLVMGSEGRGEQILKTDQDNALLLRDGHDAAGVDATAARFAAALASFGYPPCPGSIMVTNPLWRQPLASFRASLRGWVYGADPEGPLRLAIFFDAAAVAGDASLLADARGFLDSIVADDASFLARFARPADQFDEPGHWWTRLTARGAQPLDLKKLGTFPIVHGVRALALQYRVREAGTAARLRALVERQRIDAPLARDTLDALHFLMSLRLTHQLRQRAQGLVAGNEVRPADLSTLEREPRLDALAIVKRFRGFLRQHFRLDAL
jgi:CBS domain-containing protein